MGDYHWITEMNDIFALNYSKFFIAMICISDITNTINSPHKLTTVFSG